MTVHTSAAQNETRRAASGPGPRRGRRTARLAPVLCAAGLAACSPTITDLTPSSGAPGDTVTISGGRLTAGTANPVAVDFNGTPATFAAAGANVSAVVPSGATSGPVHVKTAYVDTMAPGGTATSPYDFTVVQTAFTEVEPNDGRAAAGNAGVAQALKGSIGDSDPADWFKISSGGAGPWGYAVEIVAAPSAALPAGVSLRVDMEGYRSDLSAVGSLTTYHDPGPFTLWTTQAPAADIYLNVYWAGSTSQSFSVPYELTVARIPIQDTAESDDSLSAASSIAMVNGQGSHAGSHLCTTMRAGADVGMQDFYAFAGGSATEIAVVVASPSLNAADAVHVELYDNAQGYRGGAVGNASAASHLEQLTGGETAQGTWYVEVTNAWDHYKTAGAGPTDPLPLACKAPYTVTVVTQ